MEYLNYENFLNKNDLMELNGNLVDKKTKTTIATKDEFLPYFSKYGCNFNF